MKDGILVLPGKQYRSILETSSINFELKSEGEQDTIIDGFQNFLNSLSCPIQILIRVREIDIDHYIETQTQQKEREKEHIYKKQMEDYTQFIQSLIHGNKILSRKFYIVIPYTAKDISDFYHIKEQLLLLQDIISKGLRKLGMNARPLNSVEILDLFYSFYNPGQAKTQPLTNQTIELLQNFSYDITRT